MTTSPQVTKSRFSIAGNPKTLSAIDTDVMSANRKYFGRVEVLHSGTCPFFSFDCRNMFSFKATF